MQIPAAVKEAIKNFTETDEFKLLPPKPNESSFIFKWGVRVLHKNESGEHVGWICLADQHCRDNLEFIQLYSGKTSKATKHMNQAHNVTSEKYASEVGRKRTRDEEVDELKSCIRAGQDPKRVRLLLETKRIVFNQLPFRSVEHDEARTIVDLCMKDEFQHPLSHQMVNHAIVELYNSAKHEVMAKLTEHGITSSKFLTVVADFWTSKTQHAKYLGIRAYYIGNDWKLKSVLLGIRHFNPSYGDRDTGIRRPFSRWIKQMLEDFGLAIENVFGGMSYAGPDVKWMLQSGMKLQWEWCIAHMSNACTKMACGMVNNKLQSKNPGMTELIEAIVKTVRQVRDVEVMGSLFEALCELEGHDNAARLLDYRSHRFLGLTSVVKRILERWHELEQWFDARVQKARRERKDTIPTFPLKDKKIELTQLLSLLEPITALNKKSQGDNCGQVETLLTLYRLRMQTLNVKKRLRDHRSPPPPANSVYYELNELTPLIQKTRQKLCDAFDNNFFSRYLDRSALRTQSFVFELHLMLHPTFKDLDGNLCMIVRLVFAKQDARADACIRMAELVRDTVHRKAHKIMMDLAAGETPEPMAQQNHLAFSEELVDMFGIVQEEQTPADIRENQINEEMQRWRAEPSCLAKAADGKPESILSFWQRQADSGNYKYLPKLARVLFALPSSSAQIERDFGVSGKMVTSQRASLAAYNVEMGTFLNCNRPYVSIAQCMQIAKGQLSDYIPTHMLIGALDDDNLNEIDANIAAIFSQDGDAMDENEI